MRINDVMKITGLSKKAIRFYEDKGLLEVEREENGYRSYSEKDIICLNKIKLLRLCGISIADIKLLFADFISLEELLKKRKKEIEAEYGYNSKQFDNVSKTFEQYEKNSFSDFVEFLDENNDNSSDISENLVLGIDIGTTSISAAIIDLDSKTQIASFSISNGSDMTLNNPFFDEQSVDIICDKAIGLVELIYKSYPSIKCIGVTGQMHGIIYLNKDGIALSNLITWRDKRADTKFYDDKTYCDKITEITNKEISTGFGFSTHYYNCINNLVPEDAYTFCSIMDYIVMRLTGIKFPVIHTSVAASFGLFDLKTLSFDNEAVKKLEIDNLTLPEVTDEFFVAGTYKNIPVSVAIGDNQASFIGSVKNIKETILVNIGTGSQISFVTDYFEIDKRLELRPFVKGKYLLCGSALCGGESYAILERFFRSFNCYVNNTDIPMYEYMNKLSELAYNEKKNSLKVNTGFKGTRISPHTRGSITNISDENFKPEYLVFGVICGMCKELYDFLDKDIRGKTLIAASGNAVQKIRILKSVLNDLFGLPVYISDNNEEASVGAALFAALSSGLLSDIYEASEFILYRK